MTSSSIKGDCCVYVTTPNRAWLAWYIGETSSQLPGRILDVNYVGVSILIEEAPSVPVDATAWVRLEQPTPTDWVETTVVDITELTERRLLRRGPVVGHLVHLRFAGDYPYEFYKAATNAACLNDKPAAAVTEADKVVWR